MSFARLKEIQRTIAQSSSSCPSNNKKIDNDEEYLQSPSKNKTNKENFTLLIRLKVRFYLLLENVINKERTE
jgi:hypothetical protein